MISLTARIKQIISQLEKYPHNSMEIDLSVPFELLQNANKIFIEEVSKFQPENANRIIKIELESNGIEYIVKGILYKLLALNVTYTSNPTLVKDSIQYTLKYVIRNYPVHLSWFPVRSGVNYPNKEIEEIDQRIKLTSFGSISPWFELQYGINNSLFIWTGKRWKITPIGIFFKTLSIPSGTVFLLMLENYLNVPERKTPFNINPWHISRKYLEEFIKNDGISVDVGEGEYSLFEFDPNMDFLNRLDDFQLTNTNDLTSERRPENIAEDCVPVFYIADDFYETKLTSNGEKVVEKVLQNSNNILLTIIENLMTLELAGGEYFEFENYETINLLKSLTFINNEIIGDQQHAISEILANIAAGNKDITTLRAIPPTIEKILKNILIITGDVGKGDSKAALGDLIKTFKNKVSNGSEVLAPDTIHLINSIERNSILHGNITPDGNIREAFITIMLNVLIKILNEYQLWKNKI